MRSDLLFVALAELAHIPYAVQDLTNPSPALLESVGLAARTHTILGVEANSRQFFPGANAIESVVHPDLYQARNGVLQTGTLQGPGLGMQVDKMAGFVEFVEANDMRVGA